MNKKKWFNRFVAAHGRQPWALVTGGSSGMGLEYARQLAEIGCNLLNTLNDRRMPSEFTEGYHVWATQQ